MWPLSFTDYERVKYTEKGYEFFQSYNSNFKMSKRLYNHQNRYFLNKHFIKELINGKKVDRKWIMYSESTGNIFCYVCKLFTNASNSSHMFVKWGFSNWKKTHEAIESHDNSNEHKKW